MIYTITLNPSIDYYIKVDNIKLGDINRFDDYHYVAAVLNVLQYALPVAIIIFAGQGVTEAIVNAMPDWLSNGLQVAGKLLPVTGMAMLLNYMPVRKHWPLMKNLFNY